MVRCNDLFRELNWKVYFAQLEIVHSCLFRNKTKQINTTTTKRCKYVNVPYVTGLGKSLKIQTLVDCIIQLGTDRGIKQLAE